MFKHVSLTVIALDVCAFLDARELLIVGYSLEAYKNATSIADTFARQSKADLNRWIKLLAKLEISKTEFSDLVRGLKSLAAIDALKKTAVAMIEIQRVRDMIIDLVISKAFAILHYEVFTVMVRG